jgi:hypothetical protein
LYCTSKVALPAFVEKCNEAPISQLRLDHLLRMPKREDLLFRPLNRFTIYDSNVKTYVTASVCCVLSLQADITLDELWQN